MIFDLHSHSTASDGVLSPQDLVRRAAEQGVDVLALTDHDVMRGLGEAARAADELAIELVAGVEISVSWAGRTVHVVGLQVDPACLALVDGLAVNRSGRRERALRMAESLAAVGIPGAMEGALLLAENEELISRTHFARFLVGKGYVKDVKTVFKKFLVRGKPGYVPHQWAGLADAVAWIRQAGGVAVLAHPGRYDMGKEKQSLLMAEFKDVGGVGLEVVTGSHTKDQVPIYAAHAERFGFFASVGSDFHAPGEGGRELGRLMPLPDNCRPIWEAW
ncbi:MAG: 3',5'-nucleoside bisphosphate phosphatase [Hydrogenophilaceae bacterium]